jgi:hypothetical protein
MEWLYRQDKDADLEELWASSKFSMWMWWLLYSAEGHSLCSDRYEALRRLHAFQGHLNGPDVRAVVSFEYIEGQILARIAGRGTA